MRSDVYSDRGQNGDYKTTMQAWIFRDGNQQLPLQAEVLFEHRSVWKVVFEPGAYELASIYNF